MKRLSLIANLDAPKLTPDTVVELTSSGDVEPVDAAPRQTFKLGDVVDEATKGLRATYADQSKQAEYLGYQVTMEEVTDAKLGASDSMALAAQPPGSERVETAAESALEHKGTLVAMLPALGALCDWDQVKDDLSRLRVVSKYKAKVGVRFKNLTNLEAHLRQRIYGILSVAQKQAAPVIAANRSLEVTMEPFTALFTAAAEQSATTKRAVVKALKNGKKGKKGQAKDGGADAEAQGDRDGQDRPAPVKDAPPRDPR